MEAVSDNQMDYSWITQLYSHSLQNHSIKPRVSCKLTKDKSNSQSIALTMHHKLQDNRKTTCLGNTGYRDKLWNIPQGIHDWHWNMTAGMEFVIAVFEWLPYGWAMCQQYAIVMAKQMEVHLKSENPCLLPPPNLITISGMCAWFLYAKKTLHPSLNA